MQKIFLLLVFGIHSLSSLQGQTEEPAVQHKHISGTQHLKDNQHITKKDTQLNKILGDYLTLSGQVGQYFQTYTDKDSEVDREEFGNTYAFLKIETHQWQNLSFGLSGLFNVQTHDLNNSYNRAINETGPILAEIYAKYTYAQTSLTLGRQGLEWIMLDDYFEGLFVESDDISGFSLRAAWVNRLATLDPDDLVDWNELTSDNDTDGIYGLEIEWNQLEKLNLTALYYRANGAFSIFGGRAEVLYNSSENWSNELLVEFYKTKENDKFSNNQQNGSIFHVSHTSAYKDFKIALGYVQAAHQAGAGSLLNNPWDIFDEDSHTDLPNARTWYLASEYAVNKKLTLSAIYGISNTDDDNSGNTDYREFNFIVTYVILKNLNLEAAFVNLDTNNNVGQGFNKIWCNFIYSF